MRRPGPRHFAEHGRCCTPCLHDFLLRRRLHGLEHFRRIGFLGLTTDRGPQVVGRAVTRGFRFLRNTPDELDAEVSRQVAQLRTVEKVDVLVMLSEMGVANNLRLAEKIPCIDVVLSSDMHEVTREPVVAKTGTLIVEEGQDGSVVGELVLVKSSLLSVAERVKGARVDPLLAAELQRASRALERRLDELQAGILEVRMVPLEQVFCIS